MKRIFIITVMLAALQSCGTICPAATLQEEAVTVSQKYVGQVVERTNNNDHPQITKWLKEIGLPPGLAWCAAAAVGIFREAAGNLGIQSPLPKMGRVASIWDYCKSRELRFRIFRPDEAMLLGLRPGDLAIWRHGKGVAKNFDGHIEINVAQANSRQFHSDGGNTVPSNAGGQREQSKQDANKGGYYRRTRGLGFGTSFAVEGFIRIRS